MTKTKLILVMTLLSLGFSVAAKNNAVKNIAETNHNVNFNDDPIIDSHSYRKGQINKRVLLKKFSKVLENETDLDDVLVILKQHKKGIALTSVLDGINSTTSNKKQLQRSLDSISAVKNQRSFRTEIPELWLFEPKTTAANFTTNDILFAYPPSGNESEWTIIEAFDRFGNEKQLEINVEPSVPVIVLETKGQVAFQHNIALMNKELIKAGLQSPSSSSTDSLKSNSDQSLLTKSLDTTMMTKVRLNDDKEPWIKGAAEIFMITSGVKSEKNDPSIRITALNYLDHDGVNYYPNQLVLFWDDYTFNAANIQFWEEDDNTNYKELVQAIIRAVGMAGGLAGLPELTAVTEIAAIIVQAMPANWFSDDNDFVDSCYTIVRNQSYSNHKCAANNATISLKPFVLQQN